MAKFYLQLGAAVRNCNVATHDAFLRGILTLLEPEKLIRYRVKLILSHAFVPPLLSPSFYLVLSFSPYRWPILARQASTKGLLIESTWCRTKAKSGGKKRGGKRKEKLGVRMSLRDTKRNRTSN